jgi:hypothetical protein
MTVDTGTVAERRSLSFSCENCIRGDAEKLAAGPIRTTGNWSAAMIIQHVADHINYSIDGYDLKAPAWKRLGGRFIKGRILEKGMPAGLRLEGQFEKYAPNRDVSLDEAMDALRNAADRLKKEQMTAAHPMFGTLNHGEWMKLHCRHAEMHFSFMHRDEEQDHNET